MSHPAAIPTPGPVGPVTPSEGVGVLHLFCKPTAQFDGEAVIAAVKAAEAEGTQVVSVATLGHKCDAAFMAMHEDWRELRSLQTALQRAGLGAERVEATDALGDGGLPGVLRVDVDAAVEPLGEDDTVGQGIAEANRQGEAALVVDRVVVLADEHAQSSRVAPTFPHSKPLSPTLQPQGTTWRFGGAISPSAFPSFRDTTPTSSRMLGA